MATYIKRGSRWQARIRLRGFAISETFNTKGQAQAWVTQVESDILSGRYQTGSGKTLADAINRYIADYLPAKKAYRAEYSMLTRFLAEPYAKLPIDKITPQILAQWRDDRLKEVQPPTVLRYLYVLSTVFETAIKEWEWVTVNPVKAIKKPSANRGRDRIFSDEEILLVSSVLEHGTHIQRTILDCFLFAIETAMRAAEIRGLEWSDIVGNVATLQETKNGDKRQVPLSTKALAILESRRHLPRPFDIKRGTLAQGFKVYCAEAGVVGATFHDARHSAVTKMAKVLQPFDMAKVAGHKSMSQTLRYYSVSAGDLAKLLG